MNNKIEGSTENWETGELGISVEHASRSTVTLQDQMDEACGLKAISIRLEEDLIEDLKLFAEFEQIKYQPLIRKVLHRFVEGERKRHRRMQESLERKTESLMNQSGETAQSEQGLKRA